MERQKTHNNVRKFPVNEHAVKMQAEQLAQTLGEPIADDIDELVAKLASAQSELDEAQRHQLLAEVWNEMFDTWQELDDAGEFVVTAISKSNNMGRHTDYLSAFRGRILNVDIQQDVVNWDEYLNSDLDIEPIFESQKTFFMTIALSHSYANGAWMPSDYEVELPFTKILTLNKPQ